MGGLFSIMNIFIVVIGIVVLGIMLFVIFGSNDKEK